MISIEFEIPKATPITNLYTQVFDLGIHAHFIKSAKVTIPSGHKGLAFLQVNAPGFQMIPALGSNPAFVFGDNEEKLLTVNRIVDGPPYNIICKGYNLDSFLPHSFIIGFDF